jgi:hypothetical protein
VQPYSNSILVAHSLKKGKIVSVRGERVLFLGMFFSLLLAYVVSGLAVMIDFEQRHTKVLVIKI